jgi:cysteinyl-tRNA synthetase
MPIKKTPLHLYNSLSRKIEEFQPIKKPISLYTCGPTVYNYAHIGNLRAYVFEDVLKRVLRFNDYKIKHITNITDVGHLTSDSDTGEDKMEKGSKREGKTAWDVAKFYTNAFFHDLKELNIIPADKYPRATDHIKDQIKLIQVLEKKGFTYKTSDGIYFDTSKLPDYGKLANLKNQSLKAGARIEIGDKKNPTDFALWKFSPVGEKRQMEWKSPWGIGFPGWHIECSTMAVKYLGQPFDIHCGGIDHIPVHHTNEIAQSEAAYGKPLANYWMHGEFLLMGSDKMAKSGDNFITLQTLKEKGISPLAYRFLLLQTHYRKQLTFSWEALQAAESGLQHLYQSARELRIPLLRRWGAGGVNAEALQNQFLTHINNDLDTSGALALIWDAIKNKKITQKLLLQFDEVLGLKIKKNLKVKKEKVSSSTQTLINARDEARKNKNWSESDKLRTELEKLGYKAEDTKEGTKITKQ